MEIPLIRLTPENFVTIALLSAGAYLGVVGVKLALSKLPMSKAG